MTQKRFAEQNTNNTQDSAPTSSQPQPKANAAWGIVLSILVGVGCLLISLPWPALSPLLLAIIFGMIWSNAFGVPAILSPGIAISSKAVLRLGIVLLGLQISLENIFGLGWGMIFVAIGVVALGFSGTFALSRLFGLSTDQSLLVASGFSICGAAAVAGTQGILNAKRTEVATALALVVLFGTIMIPTVPLVADLVGFDDRASGLWAGAVTHEVAQVVAIGGIIGGSALSAAVIVKLCRVLMLAPILALLSLRQRKLDASSGKVPFVPVFILGFLVAVVIKTIDILPSGLLESIGIVQGVLLAAAMFALGCGVRFSELKKVGATPLLVGAVSTILISGIGLAGVMVVSSLGV